MGRTWRGDDTAMGGRRVAFPATPASAVLGVRSADAAVRARAFTMLVRAYWKPAYKHLRLRWRKSNEEAKDLSQSFFARAFEKGTFDGYEADRAKFRTFFKACLDNFVANAEEAQRRLKRGGGAITLSFDFDEAEGELAELHPAEHLSYEELFDRHWAQSIHDLGVQALREALEGTGKEIYFQLFVRYDLCDDPAKKPTYQELASELGIKITDVTNYLAAARRRFRELVLERLRELTASEDEFRSEAQAVLGIDVNAL